MAQPHLFALLSTPEWIAAADGDGKPALARFTMAAYNGGPMQLAGWRHPVVVDLAGMRIPSQRRPIRLQHDADRGVGHTERITIDGGRLAAEGIISRGTAEAREVVEAGRNGFPWQASIGAQVVRHDFLAEGQTRGVNGQEIVGPANIVTESVLGEISFVDLGADGTTSASIAASAANPLESCMDLKPRKEALLAAHPQHEAAILAALCDGKDDTTILAEIEAANIKAEREAKAKELADLKAAVEAAKAEAEAAIKAAADKDAEIAGLKAKLGVPPIPAGSAGEKNTVSKAEFQAMSASDKAKWIAANGVKSVI